MHLHCVCYWIELYFCCCYIQTLTVAAYINMFTLEVLFNVAVPLLDYSYSSRMDVCSFHALCTCMSVSYSDDKCTDNPQNTLYIVNNCIMYIMLHLHTQTKCIYKPHATHRHPKTKWGQLKTWGRDDRKNIGRQRNTLVTGQDPPSLPSLWTQCVCMCVLHYLYHTDKLGSLVYVTGAGNSINSAV